MLDIITLIFIVLLSLQGRKNGFIKTVLGMISIIICGIVTVFAYNYISDMGIITTIEKEVFSHIEPETQVILKLSGITGYIISGLLAVIIFIATRFIYKLATDLLSFAVPGFINSTLGAILGLAQGLAIVFFILGITYCLKDSIPGIIKNIEDTKLLSELYRNNPVLSILSIKKL